MHLQREAPPMLAVGGELKNTFCLAKDTYAFLSQHIGDMENYETLRSFEQGITHFEGVYKIQPETIVHDDHPDYMSTRYALDRAKHDGIRCVGVQHHHAHIAACMAENEIQGPVIGLSFDGTGYGLDGTIWGGEILLADYGTFSRFCHLREVPMPGGDKAVRNPNRLALAWLHSVGIEWDADLPPVTVTTEEERKVILRQIETGLNAPRTSSMGRLFDAVAALIGIRGTVNYEAQAAIELEACVDAEERGAYNFDLQEDELDPANVFHELIQDLREGKSTGIMAAKFHHGLVQAVLDVCRRVKNEHGITDVALSGGVWQNMVLLSNATKALRSAGFNVLIHRKIPANDGGLAFGQVIVALHNLNGVQIEKVPSEAQI
jgi:hydrogenase maturation protein HypF